MPAVDTAAAQQGFASVGGVEPGSVEGGGVEPGCAAEPDAYEADARDGARDSTPDASGFGAGGPPAKTGTTDATAGLARTGTADAAAAGDPTKTGTTAATAGPEAVTSRRSARGCSGHALS